MATPISFVFRREIFTEIGLYNEELPVLGDWEFNLRFIAKHDIFVIQKPLANYHHRLSTVKKILGNSIIVDRNKHIQFETIIRNKLLLSKCKV